MPVKSSKLATCQALLDAVNNLSSQEMQDFFEDGEKSNNIFLFSIRFNPFLSWMHADPGFGGPIYMEILGSGNL